MRYELADYEWSVIKPMLPNKPRGVPRVNDRRVLNGIFWVLRSGAPWRDLPEAFGPYTTCYNRFVRWRRAGVWSRIIDALATAHDAAVQMIDTSIVRVHQHGSCITRNKRQSMGLSRGGLTSKIHALVDTNGLPVRLALSPGEAHDNRLAGKLLSRLKSGSMLLADRGYDADWIRELAMKKGAWANIPPKSNRCDPICFSPYLYRARNRVERFFNRIKQCRRARRLFEALALAPRQSPGRPLSVEAARVQLLILDDWGPFPVLTEPEQREGSSSRSSKTSHEQLASTIVTSQVPVEQCGEVIGNPTLSTPSSTASSTTPPGSR